MDAKRLVGRQFLPKARQLQSLSEIVASKVCSVLCTSALSIHNNRSSAHSVEHRKVNLPPRCHQLRKVIKASTKNICLRQCRTNVKPQWLQNVALTECWLSSPHKRHTLSLAPIHLGQQHLEATRCNPWPSGRDKTSDYVKTPHLLLSPALCCSPAPSVHVALDG